MSIRCYPWPQFAAKGWRLENLISLLSILVFQDSRRRLKNSRMPRCRQFSEDRKEPSIGRSRSATDKLGDTARAENWRNPGGKKGSHPFLGASALGHLGRARGPFPSRASLLSHSPFRGYSFVAPPTSTPKELARDMRGFFNSLLGQADQN
jgi:hypothetical protein